MCEMFTKQKQNKSPTLSEHALSIDGPTTSIPCGST